MLSHPACIDDTTVQMPHENVGPDLPLVSLADRA